MTKSMSMTVDDNDIFSIFKPSTKSSFDQVLDMLKSLADHLTMQEQTDEGLPEKPTASLSANLLHWWRKSVDDSDSGKRTTNHSKSENDHKNSMGILCGSCLYELLRLTVPDCPLTNKQLREFFALSLHEFSKFKTIDFSKSSKNSEIIQHYFKLLENFVFLRISSLLASMEEEEDLIHDYIEVCLDTPRPDHPAHIRNSFEQLVLQLVEECDELSQKSVELILAPFNNPSKSTRSCAFDISCKVFKIHSEKMQVYLYRFFSDSVSNAKDDDSASTAELENVHKMVYELSKVSIDTLTPIIPILEEELKVEDESLRLLATRILGSMLCEENSPLFRLFPNAWNDWLERSIDKSSQVRQVWCEHAILAYKNHTSLSNVINDKLQAKLLDPDEKIRCLVVQLLCGLEIPYCLSLSVGIMEELMQRCRDKKSSVREAAICGLGKLFNEAYEEICDSNHETGFVKMLKKVPETLFGLFSSRDPEILGQIVSFIEGSLFPFPADSQTKLTDFVSGKGKNARESHSATASTSQKFNTRTVYIFSLISEENMASFHAFLKMKKRLFNSFNLMLSLCPPQVPDRQKKIIWVLQNLCSIFPDSSKSFNALKKLFDMAMEEVALRDMISNLIGNTLDWSKSIKCFRDIMKRVRETNPSIVHVIEWILRLTCGLTFPPKLLSVCIGREEIPEINSLNLEDHALRLAEHIFVDLPHCIRSEDVDYLMRLVYRSSVTPSDRESYLRILSNAGKVSARLNLPEIPEAFKKYLGDKLIDQDLEVAFTTLKYTLKVMCRYEGFDSELERVFEGYLESFDPMLDQSKMVNMIPLVGLFAYMKPDLFVRLFKGKEYFENFLKFVCDLLTFQDVFGDIARAAAASDDDGNDAGGKRKGKRESGDDEKYAIEQELCLSQRIIVSSMRFLTYSLFADLGETWTNKIVKIMKLWMNSPEIESMAKSAILVSHVRLQSACGLIKYHAKRKVKDANLMPLHEYTAVIQDQFFPIRLKFMTKLIHYLNGDALARRFAVLLFMAAYEPEPPLLKSIEQCIRECNLRWRHGGSGIGSSSAGGVGAGIGMEQISCLLLHALVHHPDFTVEREDLLTFSRYIQFYVSLILNDENTSFLYEMGNAIKRHYDGFDRSGVSSSDLYMMCDMMQYFIRGACKQASRPINPYPGHIPLPRSLFQPITDEAELSRITKKIYLPLEIFEPLTANSHGNGNGNSNNSNVRSRSGSRSGSRESSPVAKRRRSRPTSPIANTKDHHYKSGKKSSTSTSTTTKSSSRDIKRRMSTRVARLAIGSFKEIDSSSDDLEE